VFRSTSIICISYFFLLLSFQLDDKYHEFVIASEREALTAKLQEVEDWLYEDGEDETKDVYVANLKSSKR
jgi:heat shock protein 4